MVLTILFNVVIFDYKNSICLYKILRSSTLKGRNQARLNKVGSKEYGVFFLLDR